MNVTQTYVKYQKLNSYVGFSYVKITLQIRKLQINLSISWKLILADLLFEHLPTAVQHDSAVL